MQNHEQTQPLAVTVREACRLTGIGRTLLYDMIRDGRVNALRLGRRRLVTTASLNALIDKAA